QKILSTAAFTSGGGMIGFASYSYREYVDNLTLQLDTDANGSYETVQHVEDFTVDGDGYATSGGLTHDAAGNLTYDGVFAYTYDAWNRMVAVTKAFRDPNAPGSVTMGAVISTSVYDG